MANIWREDPALSGNKGPTIRAMTTHAMDEIETNGVFTLFIDHVETFHGGQYKKGFRPHIRHVKFLESGTVGRVIFDTTELAYDKAVRAGQVLLAQHTENFETMIERIGLRLVAKPKGKRKGT